MAFRVREEVGCASQHKNADSRDILGPRTDLERGIKAKAANDDEKSVAG